MSTFVVDVDMRSLVSGCESIDAGDYLRVFLPSVKPGSLQDNRINRPKKKTLACDRFAYRMDFPYYFLQTEFK